MIALTVRIFLTLALCLCLTGCSAPGPEVDLESAIAALDIASLLPGLTPADQLWIAAASQGLACSAAVLGNHESVAQEATDIAICVSTIPAVPPVDQPYIAVAISLVRIFVDLYVPVPAQQAVQTNMAVQKLSIKMKSALTDRMSVDADKALVIKDRVLARKLK